MSPAQDASKPLDLRLLPAALAAAAAALCGVHLEWDQSRILAAACGVVLCLGLLLVSMVGWPFTARAAVRRSAGFAVQMVLCGTVLVAVACSVTMTQRGHETSGWSEAVKNAGPADISFRVLHDPQPLATSDFQGRLRERVTVRVDSLHAPGSASQTRTNAEAVLILHEDRPALRPGHRYRGRMNTQATEAGDSATAVLHPWGDEEIVPLPADRLSAVMDVFSDLRASTVQAAQSTVGDAPAVLPGVILGDRTQMSTDLKKAIYDSGLSHLTVVSGTHCGLLMGALLMLLRLLRAPRWSTLPTLIGALILFVLLVQPAPSVIRAAVMGSIGALAVFAGRGRASSALLCTTVVVLLIGNPWYITQPAFQLSVCATAGIVLVGHRLRQVLQRVMPGIVAAPLALAASAQVFVTPVLLPLVEGINTYSVPANLVAAPLLPFATVPGTLAAVLSAAVPPLAGGLLWIAGWPAAGIGAIARATDALPQTVAPWPQGSVGMVLVAIYLTAALLVCRLLVLKRRPGRVQLMLICTAGAAVAALVIPAGAFPLAPTASSVHAGWRVALCDVGQGDMLAVRTGERAAVVIDAGEDPDTARDCLINLRIETVEVLMITHDHADHYGGTPGVLEAAETQLILYSGARGWSPSDSVAELEGSPVLHRAEPGQTGSHPGQYDACPWPACEVTWKVWAAADYHRNTNNNSLVVEFTVGGHASAGADGPANDPLRLLTTGDLEEELTGFLLSTGGLPSETDILKVAHHGAANGGTALIAETGPDIALIGVGEDNSYGHPAPAILEALDEAGAVVYRTDQHGTVVLSQMQARWTVSSIS
ncbi:ComEC/Rec2 family competence protein [Nesterenkonia flava]|uniref:ComEC/Rec2 family competence protein n=1 Tax=Nesterenkonia flava TaxID=469799 RepID=A0ABU1FTV8_9MICC|nr:ComEC/Rec2 family competence protein [Nesterenkonia flava]MDR5712086.1 ComEC/Rec2 family competence protein [Nesterenkonia flava]